MEGLIGIGAVILGILLRFGIPVLCTALLIWLLRKLDQRWQREGTRWSSRHVGETGWSASLQSSARPTASR